MKTVELTYLLLYSSALYGILWLFHLLFRRFVARSPLDNIAGPPSPSFLKGSMLQIFNNEAWDFHRELPQKYGSVVKIKGALNDNLLYVLDPLALYHILVKDQPSFMRSNIHFARLVFGEGLLSTAGDVHRKQRKMLNPVFSAAHMREMVPLFYGIGHKLEKAISRCIQRGDQEIDMLTWLTRTALELIAQSGLGSSFDPLTEDAQPHPYASATKQVGFHLSKTNIFRIYLLPLAMKLGPARFRRAVVEMLPFDAVQDAREVIDQIDDTAIKIFESNKKRLGSVDDTKDHVAQGKDVVNILMKYNLTAAKEEQLTDKEIIAQMSTFTFAATDTTATAISRALWILSERQDVQDKLRVELQEAMSDRDSLLYDELVALKYLDAVCREVLRLYAPVPMITRDASEDTILPLQMPIQGLDGQTLTEILVPKGTKILLGVWNTNRNPVLWGKDADEFRPERWLEPLPEAITNSRIPGVYSNLMTFGGGIRSCIGFKFSQLEMKVMLSILVRRFKFSLPKDKNINWTMTILTTPNVGKAKEDWVAQLPLVVEEVGKVAV